MPTVVTKDGTTIFYKDWGNGRPVVFSHGWPPTRTWDPQLMFMASNGFELSLMIVVGTVDQAKLGREHDEWLRRRPRRPDRAPDLHDAALVGHSTGGEVVRYIGHTERGVSKVARQRSHP
jgi:non-heme chloroperoxidase